MKTQPPFLAQWFLRKFLRDDLAEDVVGDLEELFAENVSQRSLARARLIYWYQAASYLRPFAFRKFKRTKSNGMTLTYFKSAYRNLTKSKLLAAINIAGLSIGIAVALAIGLWILDEINFNQSSRNKGRIGQVIQNVTNNGEVQTWFNIPWPLADELRKSYGDDFEKIVLTTPAYNHLLTTETKKFNQYGFFAEPGFCEMFSVDVVRGTSQLADPSSLLISESTAKSYFGNVDPINQVMKLDDRFSFKITGVFKDFDSNHTYHGVSFIAPWETVRVTDDIKGMGDPWRPNSFFLYVQLNERASFADASIKIRDAKLRRVNEQLAKKKPALFLLPMNQWRLNSEFHDGKNTGGRIRYVWLFGFIGSFVLIMACINFMNLTTARSEQRAKEVGIRKTIGSLRKQLIAQFLCESLLVATLSFITALLLVKLALPFFNQITGKEIDIPFDKIDFWLTSFAGIFLVGMISGSYPAFYLSSIAPGKALKGTFRSGRAAGYSRKALVVLQFSISIILVVGTITVFRQIQFAQQRPTGYNRTALVNVLVQGKAIHEHFDAVRNELIRTGAATNVAESGSMPTDGEGSTSGITWRGKDPNLSTDINSFGGSVDFGKTVGWEFVAGRDFSSDIVSDSSGIILNEASVKFMGFKDPIGEEIQWWGEKLHVIGVIRNVVTHSPYEPVRPSIYYLRKNQGDVVVMRLNSEKSVNASITEIERIVRQYNPDEPFDLKFTDAEYERKFGNEAQIGQLAAVFTFLAIVISCLGIFALSSFQAEQRTKEIGIRKVLGASVISLWGMLTKSFALLVGLACIIALPVSYFGIDSWLSHYNYRTVFPWWAIVLAGFATLVITLLTVSYHTLLAAYSKPAQSLRSE